MRIQTIESLTFCLPMKILYLLTHYVQIRILDYLISRYDRADAFEMYRLKSAFEITLFKDPLHSKWFEFLWNIECAKLRDVPYVAKHAEHIPLIRQLMMDYFEQMTDHYYLSSCPDDDILRRYVDHHIKTCKKNQERLRNIPNASSQSEFTFNVPFCINHSQVAVDTLLTIDNVHYNNWAFAMNADERAVQYWESRVHDFEDNLRFWNFFIRNPHPRAVELTIDWFRRDFDKRLAWFLKEYELTTQNENPRLTASILEMMYYHKHPQTRHVIKLFLKVAHNTKILIHIIHIT